MENNDIFKAASLAQKTVEKLFNKLYSDFSLLQSLGEEMTISGTLNKALKKFERSYKTNFKPEEPLYVKEFLRVKEIFESITEIEYENYDFFLRFRSLTKDEQHAYAQLRNKCILMLNSLYRPSHGAPQVNIEHQELSFYLTNNQRILLLHYLEKLAAINMNSISPVLDDHSKILCFLLQISKKNLYDRLREMPKLKTKKNLLSLKQALSRYFKDNQRLLSEINVDLAKIDKESKK
jgi:hypothetical protein